MGITCKRQELFGLSHSGWAGDPIRVIVRRFGWMFYLNNGLPNPKVSVDRYDYEKGGVAYVWDELPSVDQTWAMKLTIPEIKFQVIEMINKVIQEETK